MGKKSTVAQIDPAVKEQLDGMIRDGRATIDEMTRYLTEQLGEDAPSRSAVGRYKQSMEDGMQVFQATQGMADVWAKKLQDEPGSPIAQLAQQVLGSVALHTANSMMTSGEAIPAGELMFICKALDHLARAEKTSVDKEVKIRERIVKETMETVEKVAKQQGLSKDGITELRRALTEGMQ